MRWRRNDAEYFFSVVTFVFLTLSVVDEVGGEEPRAEEPPLALPGRCWCEADVVDSFFVSVDPIDALEARRVVPPPAEVELKKKRSMCISCVGVAPSCSATRSAARKPSCRRLTCCRCTESR